MDALFGLGILIGCLFGFLIGQIVGYCQADDMHVNSINSKNGYTPSSNGRSNSNPPGPE